MQTEAAQTQAPAAPPPERRSRRVDRISDVDVEFSRADNFAAGFNLDGARYHVWFHPDTKRIPDGTLYKNCALGLSTDDPGYFHTRRLDVSSKASADLVAKMFETIDRDNLIHKAKADRVAKETREAAQRREVDISYAKSLAGDELYEALQRMLARYTVTTPDGYEDPGGDIGFARRAIAKADTLPAAEA